MRFRLIFKQGPRQIVVVDNEQHELDVLPTEQLLKDILTTEATVEKLTGLRLHIEQV